MGTRQSEQGSGRYRRTFDRGDVGVAQDGPGMELGPRATPRGNVPAAARTRSSNPETERGDARAGDPDRARPADPAGIAPSAHTVVRSALLGLLVWLSAQAQCPRCGAPGEEIRERGIRLGGGHRSGEVLRSHREEGTPQGGPLSPLLANIMLDDLDRFLEKRGHRFCRYADDCNVYVRSKRAGERVKEAMTRFLRRELSLRVNEAKSAVEEARKRKFLGYSFHTGSKLRIASKSMERFKRKVRELTKRNVSIALSKRLVVLSQYLRGWMTYFRLTEA